MSPEPPEPRPTPAFTAGEEGRLNLAFVAIPGPAMRPGHCGEVWDDLVGLLKGISGEAPLHVEARRSLRSIGKVATLRLASVHLSRWSYLDDRLSDPRELSGVLNRALAVMGRIRRDGFTRV